MTPKEAVKYGFADKIIPPAPDNPYEKLAGEFNISGELTVLEDNWSEKLAAFIASPAVTTILTFLMLILAFSEMKMPGFGICGGLALVCLLLLFFGHYLVGLANWWEIIIFVLGIVLILAEIFVIPGFGIAGILGFAALLVGGLAMLVPNLPDEMPIPDSQWAWEVFQQGLLSISLAFIASVVGMIVIAHYLPRLPWAGRLTLKPASSAAGPPQPQSSESMKIRPGQVGITESTLRPVGQVRFGEALVDASSETGMIASGINVRVLKNDGNRIIVEEVENDSAG